MKETIAFLNSLLKDNDTIVIALSGGPDSMCLLNVVSKLPKKLNIICAHINHNIRQESEKECEFVQKYCQERKLIFETTTFSKKSDIADYTESELREKRYLYFEKIINQYHAQYLFTAHHGDDLIETILMRLTRGSNLKGYCGFLTETKKENYQIIRPLIFTTKDCIMKYNEENNIPFVLDQTNFSDKYTRNRYRHTVLPFLKKENPNVHLKYIKFSRELYKYYIYVDNLIKKELEQRYNQNILDISNFQKLDELFQTKIIEYVLHDIYQNNLYLINDKHVNLILNIINNPRPNLEINLPNNLNIIKSYNKLKISHHKNKTSEYNIKIDNITKLPNGHTIECLSESDNTSNYCIRLNSNEINLPLYVRTRKEGDKILIKNMTSPKKVKEIFINSKIEKEKRNTYPIVVDAKETIIWLPGLKKSKFDKAKNEIYDIILWYN